MPGLSHWALHHQPGGLGQPGLGADAEWGWIRGVSQGRAESCWPAEPVPQHAGVFLPALHWAACSSITWSSQSISLGRADPSEPVRHFTSPVEPRPLHRAPLGLRFSCCRCAAVAAGSLVAPGPVLAGQPRGASSVAGSWPGAQGWALHSALHAQQSSEHFNPPARQAAGPGAALGLRTPASPSGVCSPSPWLRGSQLGQQGRVPAQEAKQGVAFGWGGPGCSGAERGQGPAARLSSRSAQSWGFLLDG